MSHFVRHDNNDVTPRSDSDEGSPPFKRGYEMTLLELHPKRIFAVLGLVGKGSFSLPIIGRSLATLEMTGYENHFSFCLWGKVGKGA
jgi:hypothetical protein